MITKTRKQKRRRRICGETEIDLKVSTIFQVNPSTNSQEKAS
jgi:hypothetical protein